MKHLKLTLLFLTVSSGAFATTPAPNCTVTCRNWGKHHGDVSAQVSNSLDDCMEFATQQPCRKISFSYSGDSARRTVYVKAVSGKVTFSEDDFSVNVQHAQLGKTPTAEKSEPRPNTCKTKADVGASRCQVVCHDPNNDSVQNHNANTLDECLDLAGQAGCQVAGFTYRGEKAARKIFVREISGKITLTQNSPIVEVDRSKLGGTFLDLKDVDSDEIKELKRASRNRSGMGVDPFGAGTIGTAPFLFRIGH